MAHPPERDWMIVAPWWQWQDPASVKLGTKIMPDTAQGRLSVPVFQKYDNPGLVNQFINDPQKCLKFAEEDLVHAVRQSPEPIFSSLKNAKGDRGLFLRIQAFWQDKLDDKGQVVKESGVTVQEPHDLQYLPDGSDTRKIFLDTHKRFYLVVCQIHCDGPSFPKAARDKICEAGFVVRRRRTELSDCALKEAAPIVKGLASGRAKLTRVNQLIDIEAKAKAIAAATGQPPAQPASAKFESLLKTRQSLQDLICAEKARFNEWAIRFDMQTPHLEGWLKSGLADKVGCWGPVEEMPEDLGQEDSFPLYPLIPDPNNPVHAGQFGTIYFGILPTSSRSVDPSGRARFDDQEFYEIRCWVKRHKTPHDRDQACLCPDRRFWSRPTRVYKLASHFDLVGTAHHPVTVQLPDLNELAAQAQPALGVGFAKPKGSLMFGSDGQTATPQNPGRSAFPEICFLPIPLITIVATFVLDLFLPIVVFTFQLWWMLALKFCIPPQISVAARIKAELNADGKIGLDAGGKIGLDIDVGVETALGKALENTDVVGETGTLKAQFGTEIAAQMNDTYSPIAIANMDLGREYAGEISRPGSPRADANLEFETKVTHA